MPMAGKLNNGKLKQGYATIIEIAENNAISFHKEQIMDAIISGTTAGTPEQIDGLQTYLNSLAQTMVFDGGNSGGTSMYEVDFSPQTSFLK